ncbi:MAG: hypothetical protein IJS03_06450 [Eubacterium sp.]|nr:hypothetical protein [Eubacterium sp.]
MNQISSYSDAINYLNEKTSLGIKPGLTRIKAALDALGNPQNSFKTIHIAGTNGKGTVAATIANALKNEGYKVGLFTSPWVINEREQIQINGDFISEDDFRNCARTLQITGTDCTEFECITVMAYLYFKAQKVDYAVIECGMGGAGDATNTEKENMSVITSVSLDHTDFLGSTIDEIAEEKSGILRKNGTCVLYNDELAEHFKDKCNKLVTGGITDNLSIVNAVLGELGVSGVNELVRLPARQEKRGGVLLDGGHNVAAAKALAPLIENEVAVIGMMRDKDVEGYISLIAPKCKKIIAVDVSNPRAIKADELAKIAKKYCADVITERDAESALKYKPTLICGSFYMIREIINLL